MFSIFKVLKEDLFLSFYVYMCVCVESVHIHMCRFLRGPDPPGARVRDARGVVGLKFRSLQDQYVLLTTEPRFQPLLKLVFFIVFLVCVCVCILCVYVRTHMHVKVRGQVGVSSCLLPCEVLGSNSDH